MDIPVDGILISGADVQTSEAAMTGESDWMKKDTFENCLEKRVETLKDFAMEPKRIKKSHDLPSPILMSGTQITTGEGFFLVVMVGDFSCIGQIMAKLNQEEGPTPLQEKLEKIAGDIGKLGMYAALLTVHVLFARFFIEHLIDRNVFFVEEAGDYISEWLDVLIVGVTIIVVAVPEGLPLAVMISLSYSVKKMLVDKNFVKKLASCEIMGGAQTICSDKTGTLTKNKMEVTHIFSNKVYELRQHVTG